MDEAVCYVIKFENGNYFRRYPKKPSTPNLNEAVKFLSRDRAKDHAQFWSDQHYKIYKVIT